jgi:hypothetical protein
MPRPSFLEKHAESIQGVLGCFDRILIQGTLTDLSYAEAATRYFLTRRIRIFDFKTWAAPFRDGVIADVEALAAAEGLEIEWVKRFDSFRKEDRIAEVLAQRGRHPGVVHILKAMETCHTYRPWHDKPSGRTYLVPTTGKCAHYYVYFIDEDLGLCHLRIPTWVPFRVQFCMNGHDWLAGRLVEKGIAFERVDNAFLAIEDFPAAQRLADSLSPKRLKRRLDGAVRRFCPTLRKFPSGIYWSVMQLEYSTDIVFSSKETLATIYEEMVRTLVHAVKPDQVAMFLGRRLDPRFAGELGSGLVRRTEGMVLRHFMERAGIKMYDKFGRILRLETFTNDVRFFKHYRTVEKRDGTTTKKIAAARKTIFSLPALARLMGACNRRYLDFLSLVVDPTNEIRTIEKVSATVREDERTYRGFNLFAERDVVVLRAVGQAGMEAFGFRNRHLRERLPGATAGQVAHIIRRLRRHGLLKKAAKALKYHVTALGKLIIAASLKLREMFLVPSLRGHLATP